MASTKTLTLVLSALSALLSVAAASPLPLNINLGAYSPAIVVGDGAIEFDSSSTGTTTESVLASTGTAITTTVGNDDGATASPATAEVVKTVQAEKAAGSSILSEPASLPIPGSKELDPRP